MRTNKEEVIRTLRRLLSNKRTATDSYVGLCANLEHCMTRSALHRLFRSWPEFSGNLSYPVPSPNKYQSPEDCYHSRDKYSIGRYAASRRRLARHIIEQLS